MHGLEVHEAGGPHMLRGFYVHVYHRAHARVETIVVPEPGTLSFSFAINDNIYTDNAGGVSFTVSRVPAPGAVLLGGLGAGLVGWLRRRKSL